MHFLRQTLKLDLPPVPSPLVKSPPKSKKKNPQLFLNTCKCGYIRIWRLFDTAAWLAQLGERRSTEREVAGSNPGRTNTKGL